MGKLRQDQIVPRGLLYPDGYLEQLEADDVEYMKYLARVAANCFVDEDAEGKEVEGLREWSIAEKLDELQHSNGALLHWLINAVAYIDGDDMDEGVLKIACQHTIEESSKATPQYLVACERERCAVIVEALANKHNHHGEDDDWWVQGHRKVAMKAVEEIRNGGAA